MDGQELLKQISKYPGLQERIEEILKIAENTDGSIATADEAEERAIEEVRKLGKEVLLGWASKRSEEVEKSYEKDSDYYKDGKKNSTGKAASGKSK
jgi:hypothetical protein